MRIVSCKNWEEKDVIPVVTAAGLTKTMAPATARPSRKALSSVPVRTFTTITGISAGNRRQGGSACDPRGAYARHAGNGAAFLSDRTGQPVTEVL